MQFENYCGLGIQGKGKEKFPEQSLFETKRFFLDLKVSGMVFEMFFIFSALTLFV